MTLGSARLHLIKLSVGSVSVESLGRWQARRLGQLGRLFHQTRMMPRRRAELLEGGSIFWVIKGVVRVRQRLIGIERALDGGRSCALLLLDPVLVRILPRLHRPFQGWRYLAPEEAPPDLAALPAGTRLMSPELLRDLEALGLL